MNIGYNMCKIAGNTFGTRRTDEQKKNISNALKGKLSKEKHPMWGKKRKPTMLGKKHTQEAIDKMVEFQNKRIRTQADIDHLKNLNDKQVGVNHPRYGVKLTGDALARIQKLRIGVPSYATRRAVLEFDLKGNFVEEFECLTHLHNKCGIDISSISQTCKRKNHIYNKKYVFVYKEDYENNLECIEFIKNLE